jgi:ribosomal subunit interface protein
LRGGPSPMNIIIRTKNIEMTPTLREFIEKKIGSVEKYCRDCQVSDDPALTSATEAIVEVGKATLHHKKGDVYQAQCQLAFNGNKILARTDADDLEKAVAAVRDDLQDQLTRLKGKRIDRNRK